MSRDAKSQEHVAILVPCFNHAEFLPAAIESALGQVPAPADVIVIDDGSDDDSAAVAHRFAGVRVVRQANQGKAAAYNTGLRQVRDTDFVVFLDADDWLLPGALRAGLDAFARHPSAVLALGLSLFVDERGEELAPIPQDQVNSDHYRRFLEGNFVANPGAAMFRRRVFDDFGYFDTRLRNCEEYEMYLRVTRNAPACCHPHTVVAYRRHAKNKSGNAMRMLTVNLEILRRESPQLQMNPRLLLARRRGRRFVRSLYGNQLVNEVDHRLTRRDWGAGVPMLARLMRHYPTGVMRRIARKALPR